MALVLRKSFTSLNPLKFSRFITMSAQLRAEKAMEELKNKNPYYEKYATKLSTLQQSAPEEFLHRIETVEKQKTKPKPEAKPRYSAIIIVHRTMKIIFHFEETTLSSLIQNHRQQQHLQRPARLRKNCRILWESNCWKTKQLTKLNIFGWSTTSKRRFLLLPYQRVYMKCRWNEAKFIRCLYSRCLEVKVLNSSWHSSLSTPYILHLCFATRFVSMFLLYFHLTKQSYVNTHT